MADNEKINLFEVLDLSPAAPADEVEAAFVAHIRTRIQDVAANFDEAAVKAEEQALRALHDAFFRFVRGWVAAEIKKPRPQPDHPDAAAIKKKASAQLDSMQAQLVEFALCYMNINRFSTLLRDEIRRAEPRLGALAARNVKWTGDAGLMIGRYQKRKKQILDEIRRMAEARGVLERIDEDLGAIHRALGALFGADKVEPLQRKIIANLRTGQFDRARQAVAEIAGTKKKFGLDPKAAADLQAAFEKTARGVVDLAEQNQESLASTEEGRLFLRPLETDITFNSHVRELRKIKAFLAKYHLPYMEYKLDTLHHLKEKLMVAGSIDSLMVLYLRLITGLAAPMPEVTAVRLYENEVIDKTTYLIETQFSEIPRINERAAETVQEFRQNTADFEETAAMADLEEVAVDRPQAAGAGP